MKFVAKGRYYLNANVERIRKGDITIVVRDTDIEMFYLVHQKGLNGHDGKLADNTKPSICSNNECWWVPVARINEHITPIIVESKSIYKGV